MSRSKCQSKPSSPQFQEVSGGAPCSSRVRSAHGCFLDQSQQRRRDDDIFDGGVPGEFKYKGKHFSQGNGEGRYVFGLGFDLDPMHNLCLGLIRHHFRILGVELPKFQPEVVTSMPLPQAPDDFTKIKPSFINKLKNKLEHPLCEAIKENREKAAKRIEGYHLIASLRVGELPSQSAAYQ